MVQVASDLSMFLYLNDCTKEFEALSTNFQQLCVTVST
jgi:hypothetical protein